MYKEVRESLAVILITSGVDLGPTKVLASGSPPAPWLEV